jgi:hypothetical protein
MANFPAKLLHRLVQLESRWTQQTSPAYFIVTEQIPENDLASLPEGERIVLDCYRNNQNFVEARQRVTRDPNDQGRMCEPGAYLLGVLRELHAACSHRKIAGQCSSCIGTPVAGT